MDSNAYGKRHANGNRHGHRVAQRHAYGYTH